MTVVALVILVPALVAVAGALAVSSFDPYEPPTPRPSTQPPTPPTPRPSTQPPTPQPPEPEPIPDKTYPPLPPPHSNDPAWVTVQQAPIYTVAIPELTGCPKLARVKTMAELRTQTTAALTCVENGWRPVLASIGLPSAEVPHFYFEGSGATSACGTSQAPAFYCSANGGAIYFGDDMLGGPAIWAKGTVGHEYAHHMQALSGFVEARSELPAGNETTRRNEIQAECISVAMMRRDASIPQTKEFYDALEANLRNVVVDGIHGSPESLTYWGMRGFHGDVVGECNTWVVGSELVE